jgi:hypothetical protein
MVYLFRVPKTLRHEEFLVPQCLSGLNFLLYRINITSPA